MMRRLGAEAEPYQRGRPRKLMAAADVLLAAGVAGTVLARGSRVAAPVADASNFWLTKMWWGQLTPM